MTHSINLVREFHEKFNHPVADAPTPATEDLRVLRVRVIAEELAELCQALRVDLHLAVCCHDNGEHYEYVEAVDASCTGEPDLIEAADALGDLDYVVQGANLVFGFPAEAITREIHRSNMSKLGADGKPIYREDGKVMKGPSYSPPDIKTALESCQECQGTGDDPWGECSECFGSGKARFTKASIQLNSLIARSVAASKNVSHIGHGTLYLGDEAIGTVTDVKLEFTADNSTNSGDRTGCSNPANVLRHCAEQMAEGTGLEVDHESFDAAAKVMELPKKEVHPIVPELRDLADRIENGGVKHLRANIDIGQETFGDEGVRKTLRTGRMRIDLEFYDPAMNDFARR